MGNHLMLVDLRQRPAKGKHALDRASITCNKNNIPYHHEKPTLTSGIRLGTPAGSARGFGPGEFRQTGKMTAKVMDGLPKNGEAGDTQMEAHVSYRVEDLCVRLPIYQGLRYREGVRWLAFVDGRDAKPLTTAVKAAWSLRRRREVSPSRNFYKAQK